VTSNLANPSTALRCGQPFSVGVVVKNGSCASLPVQSVQLTQNAKAGTFCSAVLSQFSYVPQVGSVGAGQTTTVLNFVSAPFCCTGGPCPGVATCAYDETFAVQTGAGPVNAGTAPIQVSFDPNCPICP
jgi:hypothetical protein